MRSGIVMGGCYLGMAGHDVFNNKVREIVNTNEHRVVLLALDISNFKYINDFTAWMKATRLCRILQTFILLMNHCALLHTESGLTSSGVLIKLII